MQKLQHRKDTENVVRLNELGDSAVWSVCAEAFSVVIVVVDR